MGKRQERITISFTREELMVVEARMRGVKTAEEQTKDYVFTGGFTPWFEAHTKITEALKVTNGQS